jgi:hypothetical protein
MFLAAGGIAVAAPAKSMPALRRVHGAEQLFVDGEPFLVRGGELGNSSASDPAYLKPFWPKLAAMNLNTVIAPVYWELIEPKKGRFDFASVDGLLAQARQNHMRLVLLWFGSWKNSMSSYVPGWVKRDAVRFPRAQRSGGSGMEILSSLGPNNVEADATAFAALMAHLKTADSAAHTVIMVQVENEIGMIPEARDRSAAADTMFAAPVPKALADYLAAHHDTLEPDLKAAWDTHGDKTGSGWADTFGPGIATDEYFNAWVQARYAEMVAARGKARYPLPLYVNAALIRVGKTPGQYPSGGPLPHLFDIWHAAAPSIDILAPDIYFANFDDWATKYARADNPLFIPETRSNHTADAFFAYGKLNAIAFSPFAIESAGDDEAKAIKSAYQTIIELSPLILSHQGTGTMAAVQPPSIYDGATNFDAQKVAVGDYLFEVSFAPPKNANALITPCALIVQTGQEEFVVAGAGATLTFSLKSDSSTLVGIDSVHEGHYVAGRWAPGRLLNGDQTNQGRQLQLPRDRYGIQRLRLYRYH